MQLRWHALCGDDMPGAAAETDLRQNGDSNMNISERAIMTGIGAVRAITAGATSVDITGTEICAIFTAMLDIVLEDEISERIRWEQITTPQQRSQGNRSYAAFVGKVPVAAHFSVQSEKGKGLLTAEGRRRSYVWTCSLPGINPPEGQEMTEALAREKITEAIASWFKAIRS